MDNIENETINDSLKGTWSLDILYKGFDDPKLEQDFIKLESACADINSYAKSLSDNTNSITENLETGLKLQEELSTLISDIYTFAMLKQSTDTTDSDCNKAIERVTKLINSTTIAGTIFNKYVASVTVEKLDEAISNSEYLKQFSYLLNNIKKDAKYELNEDVEDALARMDMCAGSAWNDQWQYITSTVKVDYNGDTTTLSDIRNKAYDADKNVRKEAYDAEIASYEKIKDAAAFSLNSIKLQTLTNCELRGYEGPLQKTLYEARMKKETLDALIEAMKEYLPKFHEYLKAKAKALGYENGSSLAWYDLFAPLGSMDKKYTVQEAKNYLLRIFHTFDTDLEEMVKRAFDDEWIDFYPREGKVGGAFCASLEAHSQSRILANFDGSFSDIVTLAHELGHAYHNLNIEDNSILNMEYSMPVAETASTFNENVIVSGAIEEATDSNVKLALMESQLSDTTQIICDIYSRYLFETYVFEGRENGFMYADELCQLMHKAQVMAYGDGIIEDTLHPYMWACKSHYYSAGLSFYNFPYAFGGLFARGLYARYKNEGESFIPKYREMLKNTPICDVEDAAKIIGVDLTDINFWRESLESYSKQIDEFVKLVG